MLLVTIERIRTKLCAARTSVQRARAWRAVTTIVLVAVSPIALAAQAPRDDDAALTALLAQAASTSPRLRASAARTAAARARIGPAGSRPDPMLMTGLQNFPLFTPGFDDSMTMKMLGLSQTVLAPGKLRLRRAVAERDADAVAAIERSTKAELIAAVKVAWYDLAFIDTALTLTGRQRVVLDGISTLALTRYNAGAGSQSDVLTARIDVAKLLDEELRLRAEREATVAALNALLDRSSGSAVNGASIPVRLRRAATAGDTNGMLRDSLRAPVGVGRSLFPPLSELQLRAAQTGAMLVAHESALTAQDARVALARTEVRPDFDISLQYGQRDRLPDMVTVQVAIPLRLQKRTKQAQLLVEAQADLLALNAEHEQQLSDANAVVARLLSAAERARATLALFSATVLPQARAAVDASLASYRGNTGTMLQVLSAQSALLQYDMTMARTFSDFAKSVAALELVVGSEVLP